MTFSSAQLAEYVAGRLVGDATIQCSGATIDSRSCTRGAVFFAIQGESVDGHAYVDSAIESGCSIAIVEKELDDSVPHIVVEDSRKALFDLAKCRREKLSLDSVVAVTGSVGKTTVKDMLGAILGDGTVVSQKSFNNDLGGPLTILSAESASMLVAEVGANDVGEIQPLAELVQPEVAILTSIEAAHLEGFGNLETVLAEKATLLEALPSKGYAIVPFGIDVSTFAIQAKVVSVGQTELADVPFSASVDKEGYSVLHIGGKEVQLSTLGVHNAHNGALAVVASMYANPTLTLEHCLQQLAHAVSPKGRLCKQVVDGVAFYDDSYNANPASMRSALSFFGSLQSNRKVLILGDMLELGDHAELEHRALASFIVNTQAEEVILVGDSFSSIAKEVGAHHENCVNEESLQRMVSLIQAGDSVLLKGSRGMRLERILDFLSQTKVSNH